MQITSKRTLTFALSTVLTLGLVGCATTPAEEETSGSSGSGGSGTSETATGTVEVFSWWTGGGEEAGLNALVEVFNAEYPNIEFVNAAVAGGAGTNARAVLATRLEANDPPDSFQGHAGAELMDYITAGQLEDLSALYEVDRWR